MGGSGSPQGAGHTPTEWLAEQWSEATGAHRGTMRPAGSTVDTRVDDVVDDLLGRSRSRSHRRRPDRRYRRRDRGLDAGRRTPSTPRPRIVPDVDTRHPEQGSGHRPLDPSHGLPAVEDLSDLPGIAEQSAVALLLRQDSTASGSGFYPPPVSGVRWTWTIAWLGSRCFASAGTS